MKNFRKGFTMIELLIVIAVLGVLATAVLSAINPIEQINRSKDTGTRSDAEQLISAIDRYYTSQGIYPWQSADTSLTLQGWHVVDNTTWQDDLSGPVLPKLSEGTTAGTGELKAAFTAKVIVAGYNKLNVYNAGTQGSSTYVCFLPKSASFLKEAQTRCAAIIATSSPSDYPPTATTCPGGTSPAIYYSCLP